MKKVTILLSVFALVMGLSQCRKPSFSALNGGEPQHVVLNASWDNGGSKIDQDVTKLKWTEGDKITVRQGGNPIGTLECVDVAAGIFEGYIMKTTGNITFTFGSNDYKDAEDFMGQSGELNDAVSLTGEAPYSADGKYDVSMTMPHAVLKLDLSALGTEGGTKVTIKADNTEVASVSGVKTDSENVYVAFPVEKSRDAKIYEFVSIVGSASCKGWELKENTFYTLTGGTGQAIVVTPSSPELLPGKFSVSATEYVQFSRGNLFCTRSGSEGSYTYEFGLENNQYDFRTRPGYASVINGVYAVNGTGANMSGHFQWDIAKAQAGKDYGAFGTTAPSGGTTSDVLDWGPALDAASHWTTLSSTEWNYLLKVRKVKSATGLHNTCEFVYFKGVDGLDTGVDGLIIYPDGYDGKMFTNQQEITAIPDGCVFIPMAGRFGDGAVTNFNMRCNYWTSSAGKEEGGNAYQFLAYGDVCNPNNLIARANGLSVRLVQKFVKSVQIGNLYWATENLAITSSGKREFNHTGHINGDYFQWAAYTGYCGNATDADKGLLIYTSFKSKMCGDGSNAFTYKSGKEFNESSTPYCSGSSYTKYTSGDVNLEDSDDVAKIILGGSWRMPTATEFKTMCDATYWAWDDTDKGYYVYTPNPSTDAGKCNTGTGFYNKSNALLFFPAAAYGSDKYNDHVGNFGLYWSSSLKSNPLAYDLYFSSSSVTPQDGGGRYSGLPVRPVSTTNPAISTF